MNDVLAKKRDSLLNSKFAAKGNLDVGFLLLVFALLAIGLVMLASAGYSLAYYKLEDSYDYIRDQVIFAALGLVAMFAISKGSASGSSSYVHCGSGSSYGSSKASCACCAMAC